MNKTIINDRVNTLLNEKKIINAFHEKLSLEISNLLDKNKMISLYEIRLTIAKDEITKTLYLKLINSLINYSGKNVFLVIIDYISFQELCLIDENIENVLCHWGRS